MQEAVLSKIRSQPTLHNPHGKTPYACDVCGKEFTQKTGRDRHHRSHTGERPFVCYVCNKGFAHKGNLITHLKMHTGEKPFACDVCNEAFAQKGHLKNHVRTHTGEKPFVCEVSNEAFAQKSNFKRHARTHTRDKPYKCPFCGKAFTTSSYYNKEPVNENDQSVRRTSRRSDSPDLAPSDFHLFLHLKSFFGAQHFNDEAELKEHVTTWLKTQAATFCEEGIQKLVPQVLTYGEHNPCVFYKNDDNVYSLPTTGNSDEDNEEAKDKCTENSNENSLYLSQSFQQKENKESELINLSLYQHNEEFKPLPPKVNKYRNSAECSVKAQLSDPCDISYFNPISDAQATEVQGKEITSFTASSENIESAHRPEIVHRGAYEKTTVSAGSSVFQIQNQSASGVSDLLYATTDEEPFLENSKWQTLNYDKINFIESLECVVKTGHSESKSISGNENLILKNVSECVNHKNISPEMHSQGHNNKKKRSTDLKEPISTKEDDNAVAGPSGFCSGKKKFPKSSCKKDTPKTNYRTRTSEKRDICKKEFSQKSGLNLHYITHTGKTPYACDVCGKEFTQKTDRDRHHRTHTGERPFVCYVCNKGFARKCNLKNHDRTHTGEKPFVCDVCNEAFARKGTLKAHARTHTGEKPYKCPFCGKAFTTSSNCNFHQRSAHK
ncbi:zinc finger protein 614-like [Argiope bruennichi]|uniref:zinc finger protein 614-like n=1 Tax=Argiope bruennichi TaxID=94029 RepID=UPI00249590F0|nr:zinc finger protein 614-like [Argiope bruennichi]